MTDSERIERLENVVGKLIAWSMRELGSEATRQLMKELNSEETT